MRLGVRVALFLDRLGGHAVVNGTPATRRVTKELRMSLPSYAVDFRGHPCCPCQAKWLPVFEGEAQRRGILRGPLPLSQIIGGYAGSGETHVSGGADDTYPLDGIDVLAYVALSRQMGADATWERPYNWDGRGGVRHVHRVLRGCPHNGPARYQIVAVDQSFNGLGHLGESAADDGPRPLSGRTWREGIQWAREQEDIVAPEDIDKIIEGIRPVIREEVAAQFQKEQVNGRNLRANIVAIARKVGVKPAED